MNYSSHKAVLSKFSGEFINIWRADEYFETYHLLLLFNQILIALAILFIALTEVQTLQGFIPICAHCHNIRNDNGFWERIEQYIQERTHAQFSHGICPDCKRELYPELYPD